MEKVMIYSRSTCKDCDRVKDYLKAKGVPFQDINIVKDKKAGDEMEHRYGTHITPVVVVGDRVMVGFNMLKLDKLLSAH
jgi:glutaredoxin-like YruB-family protein